jgi:hypothetical protein
VRILFLLFSFFVFHLYACQGGYVSCIKKIQDSQTIQKNSLYIPVNNNKLLVYSSKKPDAKILKYDPFLSLYLIEDRKKFPYPFDVNMRVQLGTAVVNSSDAKEGKILHHQVGLNHLGLYSESLKHPALITSSCCSLEGIASASGVIEKEYIQRFLSKSRVEYSDIGIRVEMLHKSVVVQGSNPFWKNNPFKKGDVILSYDGKKVDNASLFMRKVLFSKVNTSHKVLIKRKGVVMHFDVTTAKRYGGGALSDTFLEQKGIYFDKKLHIIELSEAFKVYGLALGDRLLQVNGKSVSNQDELQHYIEDFKDFSSLLFERRKFQFFVNIK